MHTLLYVCVHNAGRSQMAEAITNALAAERNLPIRALSAGTIAGECVNPNAMLALQEIGICTDDLHPKPLTQAMADQADRIISMGCGVDVAACPARFLLTEDWQLEDPAGKDIAAVRRIRDAIRARVEQMLTEGEAGE